MYYKKGEHDKCKKYIKEIKKNNKYIIEILSENIAENHEYIPEYYSLGSKEEAFVALNDYLSLISSAPLFIYFIENNNR